MTDSSIQPFRIAVPQAEIDDLHHRLDRTRWPDEPPGVGWRLGAPIGYLRELAEYWRTRYVWRSTEAQLNSLPQFVTQVDGHPIHFVHVRSSEPTAFPMILTHGWPSTFVEFLALIAALTEPGAHGGEPADAFHLVIPSVPGFGLSGPTRETGWTVSRVARAWAELMRRLGYTRYGAHGGDLGALVSRELALQEPERVAAIHVQHIFSAGVTHETADMSVEAERRSAEAAARYEYELGGYAAIQGTRPQSIAYGLTDSPIFQLEWIVERFKDYTDSTDGPEDAVDRDQMLTNVMLYWLTRTAGTSARYYNEGWDGWGELEPPLSTPTAVAVFSRDIFLPIRRLAERNHTIVRWTEFDRGGHFPAMEVPELLIDDLRATFRPFR